MSRASVDSTKALFDESKAKKAGNASTKTVPGIQEEVRTTNKQADKRWRDELMSEKNLERSETKEKATTQGKKLSNLDSRMDEERKKVKELRLREKIADVERDNKALRAQANMKLAKISKTANE